MRRLPALVVLLLLAACPPVVTEEGLFTDGGRPDNTCPADPGPQGRSIESNIVSDQSRAAAFHAELRNPDRLTVVLCGTSAPVPSARAQTCTAIFVGGRFFVFDTGDRSQPSMEALDLPMAELDGVFITHFHSDHIADLGETISRSWILGRTTPLVVYGPVGIEPIIASFLDIYSRDVQYRNDHHGSSVFPEATMLTTAKTIQHNAREGVVVYDAEGIVVRAFTVEHEPVSPSVGYRIEYRGKVVGISGDTTDSEGLAALGANADVLVSEALDQGFVRDSSCAFQRAGDARNAKILADVREYHVGAETLGRLAQSIGVRTLMLTHLLPAVDANTARDRFTPHIRNGGFTGSLVVGEDGSTEVVNTPR